jgi:hypothetical protein
MNERIDVGDIIAPVLQLVPGGHTTKVQGYSFCRHGRTLLEAEQRVVTCRDCGKTLDAFDVLLEYAQGERRWQSREAECRDAAKRLEELKSEERKVKARTKNASRKEAAAAVAAEQVRTERERLVIAELARDAGALCRRIDGLTRRSK